MGVLVFLLFLFLFFFFFPVIYSRNECPTSMCSESYFTIHFLFSLKTYQLKNCGGYYGFNLHCNDQGNTLINLPYSGEFLVRGIKYNTQEIQLYDPYNCLPRRLLKFNLSNSPFMASYYKNYTFLTCPSELTMSRFTVINCLSNSTNTTLATTSMALAKKMSMCEIIGTLPIPVSWSTQYQDEFSSDFGGDLLLTWDEPNCKDCEAQGRMCGFQNNTSQEGITCFSNPKTVGNNHKIFRIIALSITLPAITCAFGITLFICCITGTPRPHGTHATRPHWTHATRLINLPAVVTPVQLSGITTGLDESTIESYTKVVLGESRRLPGLNSNSCPICLSENHPKETLRCIPECKHCFHVECIDEWLRLNGTCPVCRNSPFPAHVHLLNQNV